MVIKAIDGCEGRLTVANRRNRPTRTRHVIGDGTAQPWLRLINNFPMLVLPTAPVVFTKFFGFRTRCYSSLCCSLCCSLIAH